MRQEQPCCLHKRSGPGTPPSDVLVATALLIYLAGASGMGRLLALGAPPGCRTAVILPTAMRDFAVAAGIAASAFGIAAAAPLGIYAVMVLVFGAITVYSIQTKLTNGCLW